MSRLHSIRLLVLIPLALLGFTACGGGDGGGTSNPFEGAWQIFAYSPTGLGQFGKVTAQGDGTVELTGLTKFNDGSVIGPDTESGRFELDEDGALRLFVGSGPVQVYEGGLGVRGQVAVLGITEAGSIPLMLILVRLGAPPLPTNLDGDYRDNFVASDGVFATTTSLLSDGATTPRWSTLNESTNRYGSLDTRALVGGGTYSVRPDGVIEERSPGGALREATATPDHNLIVYGGDLTDGRDTPFVGVRVRRSGLLATSDLAGEYFGIGVELEDISGIARSLTGTFSADGLGNATFSGREFDGSTGTVSAFFMAGIDYAIDPDGTANADFPGPDMVRGGITPDGHVAVFAGSTTTANGAFYVLVRKN